jgi:hypothetical protein
MTLFAWLKVLANRTAFATKRAVGRRSQFHGVIPLSITVLREDLCCYMPISLCSERKNCASGELVESLRNAPQAEASRT